MMTGKRPNSLIAWLNSDDWTQPLLSTTTFSLEGNRLYRASTTVGQVYSEVASGTIVTGVINAR